jgi:SWI/SNF-related matrix-associated actin-dependent regulator of chromatin subfamily A3
VDIPSSAKSILPTNIVATAEGSNVKKKRKADDSTPLSSNAIPAPVTATLTRPLEEEPLEEVAEEEVRDEIYCTVHTNVVGIQYYKGLADVLLSLFTDLFLTSRPCWAW